MVDVSGGGPGPAEPGYTATSPGFWVVLVADPVTGETDAFGPFDHASASVDAQRRRVEHASEGLDEVVVVTVPLTPPGE